MSSKPTYTEYHPRWYRPRMSIYWWVQRWAYLKFILRELSSVFVAWFVVYLLLLLQAVVRGKEAYEQLLTWSSHPLLVGLNLLCFFFVVYHAVTWFNLAPKALAVRFRGERVPALWIAGSNYLAWVAVSTLVAWLLLGGSR